VPGVRAPRRPPPAALKGKPALLLVGAVPPDVRRTEAP